MHPIQITFRGMSASEALAAHIEAHYARLMELGDLVQSGHAVVSQPHRHQRRGRHFQVHLQLHTPGKEIVVTRDPAEREAREDAYEAVDEAFEAAARMIKDRLGQLRSHQAA